MREKTIQRVNAIAVSAYKAVGTAILAAILVGVVSYLATHGFFMLSRGWMAPQVLSGTDTRVLDLNTRLAERDLARERLLGERRALEDRLADAERTAAALRVWRERFREAMKAQRRLERAQLSRLAALGEELSSSEGEIAASNRAYGGMARTREEALRTARLVDREHYLTTNHQLAQLALTNLGLAERSVDLDFRLAVAKRRVRGLASLEQWLAAPEPAKAPAGLSADLLELQQQFFRNDLELARAEANRRTIQADIEATDRAVAQYVRLGETVRASGYVRAAEGKLTIAFVPYENMESVTPGAPVYGCALGFVWCRHVGTVGELLEGEAMLRHPIRSAQLRGVMVEIRLDDPRWARQQILHAVRPPLFF